MKQYVAELGIYENCHIVDVEHIGVDSYEEAEAIAQELEDNYSAKIPESDWWVRIDDYYLQ